MPSSRQGRKIDTPLDDLNLQDIQHIESLGTALGETAPALDRVLHLLQCQERIDAVDSVRRLGGWRLSRPYCRWKPKIRCPRSAARAPWNWIRWPIQPPECA
jgi:hypothetical protein